MFLNSGLSNQSTETTWCIVDLVYTVGHAVRPLVNGRLAIIVCNGCALSRRAFVTRLKTWPLSFLCLIHIDSNIITSQIMPAVATAYIWTCSKHNFDSMHIVDVPGMLFLGLRSHSAVTVYMSSDMYVCLAVGGVFYDLQ